MRRRLGRPRFDHEPLGQPGGGEVAGIPDIRVSQLPDARQTASVGRDLALR